MRVWLLQGRQGEDPGGVAALFRQWKESTANSTWNLEPRSIGPDLLPQLQSHRPELAVLASALIPARTWLDEVLSVEVGVVLVVSEAHCEGFRELAERWPLELLSPTPTPDCIGFALRNALAALRRHQFWKLQVEHLNQRLNDRIIIERAKGVLVQRLGISEEEAYKRLRVLSRRQRRQIRDIAQSLLDTQALLSPGFDPHANGDDSLDGERPKPTEDHRSLD
jgi:hypothetical protein